MPRQVERYLSSFPDYYSRTYSWSEFHSALQGVRSGKTLYVSNRGLITIGKMMKIWQTLKGWFGFANYTNRVLVQGEVLRLAFYGVSRGYISEFEARDIIRNSSRTSIQHQLISYFKTNSTVLKRFNRCHGVKVRINKSEWKFGDTYLAIAEQQAKTVDEALRAYYLAAQLHNLNDIDKVSRSFNAFFERLGLERYCSSSSEVARFVTEIAKLLAKRYYRAEEYSKAVKCFDVVREYKGVFRGGEWIIWMHCALQNDQHRKVEEILDEYGDDFAINEQRLKYIHVDARRILGDEHATHFVIEIAKLLAKRYYTAEEYSKAVGCFDVVGENKGVFREEEWIIWMDCALQNNQHQKVEEILDEYSDVFAINNQRLKDIYVQTCLILGDEYAAKKDTWKTWLYNIATLGATPSGAEHCQKAIQFYRQAMGVLKGDPSKIREILQKISCLESDHLAKKSEYLKYGKEHAKKREWKEAAHFFLLALKLVDPLSSKDGREVFLEFNQAVIELYNSGQRDKEVLDLIDEAIQCRGPIESRLYEQYAGWLSSETELKSDIKGFINSEGSFRYDVGSRLHFLKAQILQLQQFSPEAILEEYEIAAKLAPKNEWGVLAILLKDDQHSPADDLNALIKNYRDYAIKWGAADRVLLA